MNLTYKNIIHTKLSIIPELIVRFVQKQERHDKQIEKLTAENNRTIRHFLINRKSHFRTIKVPIQILIRETFYQENEIT